MVNSNNIYPSRKNGKSVKKSTSKNLNFNRIKWQFEFNNLIKKKNSGESFNIFNLGSSTTNKGNVNLNSKTGDLIKEYKI